MNEQKFVAEEVALNAGTSDTKHIAKGKTMQITLVGGTMESPMPNADAVVVIEANKPVEIFHPTHATAYIDVPPGEKRKIFVIDQVEANPLGDIVQAFD
jgi:hypothetical protein